MNKKQKKTYRLYPVFGGGYEVWDIVNHQRETCMGLFPTKEEANHWAKENLTSSRSEESRMFTNYEIEKDGIRLYHENGSEIYTEEDLRIMYINHEGPE